MKEKSQLEIEFEQAIKDQQSEVDKFLKLAENALDEAAQIAELNGIPFILKLKQLSFTEEEVFFMPRSFKNKWLDQADDLDHDQRDRFYNLVHNSLDIYSNLSPSGWRQSLIC